MKRNSLNLASMSEEGKEKANSNGAWQWAGQAQHIVGKLSHVLRPT